MIKSIHIGRYVTTPPEFLALAKFLEAIGLERMPGAAKASAAFVAPQGIISFNHPTKRHPPELNKRLKDIDKVVVLEVSNADDVLAIARNMEFKVLADSTSAETGERAFWLELPAGIVVAIHGQPEAPPPGLEGKLDARGKRFAIVVARFNSFITERLLQGALDGLTRSEAKRTDIQIVRVPGSFEIPSAARSLAETKNYDAVLCIGCLLRGDTAHYDVIVNEVTRGVGQSAQETGVPHAFGVLTCDTLEQAIDRAGLKMGNKGFEAALAAIEMANLQSVIRPQRSSSKSSGRGTKKVAGSRSSAKRNAGR